MPLGLYVHTPFCVHKCAYCNFASGTFSDLDHTAYVDAVLGELASHKELRNNVQTVFVGGGTPSFLKFEALKKLLRGIASVVGEVSEWTVENNPNSLQSDLLKLYRDCGVTRLSLGVQSFVDTELKFLQRQHSAAQAHQALEWAQEFYPGQWSADLIYALPGQSPDSWQQSLNSLLQHEPAHVSCYELTYETSTPLGQEWKAGRLEAQPDTCILQLQALATDRLGQQGLTRYEISNFALMSKECRHNLLIWEGMDYVGIGNGAHSRVGDLRWRNTASPLDYVARLKNQQSPACERDEDLTAADRLQTELVLGLRCLSGVSHQRLVRSTGKGACELWPALPDYLSDHLELDEKGVRCRHSGWAVLDTLVDQLCEKALIKT